MHTPIDWRPARTFPLIVVVVLATGAIPLADRSMQQDGTSLRDDDHAGKFSDATIIIRWSELAHENAFAIDPAMTDPFPSARGWTMMYLAMHDALNAVVPRYEQYAFFETDRSAHPIAAAAQAARDVMNHIYPTRQAQNDAELAFWLGQVPDGSRKARGIRLGMASAEAIIKARVNDKMLVAGEYAVQSPLEPGDYRRRVRPLRVAIDGPRSSP